MYYILVDDSSTDGGSHSPQYTHLYCITLDAICEIAVNLTLYRVRTNTQVLHCNDANVEYTSLLVVVDDSSEQYHR